MKIKYNDKLLSGKEWCDVEIEGEVYDLYVYFNVRENKYCVQAENVNSHMPEFAFFDFLEVVFEHNDCLGRD